MIYQCFILRLDYPGLFHKIMTVSNEKFDYILTHLVWKHSFNIAVTSQNKGSSINDVGNFSGFLTPPSPMSAVFYYVPSENFNGF